MLIPESIVLLPCHSLEDFPTHHRSLDADSLLACWTVPWHPRLMGATERMPAWRRADEPGDPVSESLLLVPTVSRTWLPAGYRELAAGNQVRLLEGFSDRNALADAIFKAYDLPTDTKNGELDAKIGDFFALGYAYLQVQLMTRQLRGSTNLDETRFESAAVAAAVAWNNDDEELTTQNLGRCFDQLLAEKNAYYPVQPRLIDLVLVAETTIGKSLASEMATGPAKSFLMTAAVGRQLQASRPENFQQLRTRVASGQVDLVGGLNQELDDPLLSVESTVFQIQRGLEWYRQALNSSPAVFARRSFGLTADLPAILNDFDFIGALHSAMTGGTIPVASTSNIRWEASDGSSILAFAQAPDDAAEGFTFLSLSVKLGRAIDSAHVASILLTHWPDRVHFCFEDLQRIGKFGPLFGKFTTLTDFFEAIYDPGYGDTFTVDEYRGEFLQLSLKAQQANPISRIVDYWQRTYHLRSLRTAFVQLIIAKGGLKQAEHVQFVASLDELQRRSDDATKTADDSLNDDIKALNKSLIQSLTRGVDDSNKVSVINTTTSPRVVHVQTSNHHVYAKDAPETPVVRFADSHGDRTDWILDVPPMSITALESEQGNQRVISREPLLGYDNRLRNEFFEVTIDRQTGGILSVDQYDRRNNLLTQLLSLRIPSQTGTRQQRRTNARYATMVCDHLNLHNQSRAQASITTNGRLIDDTQDSDTVVAEFQQTVTLFRGQPLVELEIVLTPRIQLEPAPNHYFCTRLAWKHDSAELYRSVQETRAYVMDDHFAASNWIEVRGPTDSITVLTGGLPFHRRSSRRMLDSLLLVAGEMRREFRLGLGVNLKYPHQAAADFMTPPLLFPRESSQDAAGGWMFHFNCKNILATWWSPLFDDESRCIGVELRCHEAEHRSGELEIRCPFRLSSARRVNFLGDHLGSVDTSENIATIRFQGGEYFQLQLNWNP